MSGPEHDRMGSGYLANRRYRWLAKNSHKPLSKLRIRLLPEVSFTSLTKAWWFDNPSLTWWSASGDLAGTPWNGYADRDKLVRIRIGRRWVPFILIGAWHGNGKATWDAEEFTHWQARNTFHRPTEREMQ